MSIKLNDINWRASVNYEINFRLPPDGVAGEVAGMFGLDDGCSNVLYDDFELAISPGQIAAVAGPSGSGKSVLLREFASRFDNIIWLREILSRGRKTAVEYLSGGTLKSRLAVLSCCGLAEATVLVTPAGRLSGGQKYRLGLARAIHRAVVSQKTSLVMADEFCSQLDVMTAAILCNQIRKLVSRYPIALVVATPRSELLPLLRPDIAIMKSIGSPPKILELGQPPGGLPDVASWPVTRGSIRDYRKLEDFHYITGSPACHKRVYTIRPPQHWVDMGSPEVAAVAVVSPPVINARGRNVATFGRYTGRDKRANLKKLNEEVETISRVIVHPMFRGAGLAVKLVKHAIATAETEYVEALAAMGKINPFFEKGGMTHVGLFKGPSQYYHYYITRTSKE